MNPVACIPGYHVMPRMPLQNFDTIQLVCQGLRGLLEVMICAMRRHIHRS